MLRNFVNRRSQLFTANGNFTVPSGVTVVYLTGAAAGGGAGGGITGYPYTGGGGGGGESCFRSPINVTPGDTHSITIGTKGLGGNRDFDGNAGGVTSFGSLFSLSGGGKGFKAGPSIGGYGGAPGGPSASGGGTGRFNQGGHPNGGGTIFFGLLSVGRASGGDDNHYGSGGAGGQIGGDNGGGGYLLVEWAA